MNKKIGRNDPCWCGSGKKYKQCHMLKDEETEKAKTYTTTGKRKFKAKVISLTGKGEALFKHVQGGQSEVTGEKFELTERDFRVKSQEESSYIRPESSEMPTTSEEEAPPVGEEFKPTKKNFQKEP